MNEFNTEWKQRGLAKGIGTLFCVLLAAYCAIIAVVLCIHHEWVYLSLMGSVEVAFAYYSVRLVISYIYNDAWRIGIRNETLWWDSPRWPKSKGSVPMADVCKVVIRESMELAITMTNGTIHRIHLIGDPEGLRDFLCEHYPGVAIKFIADGT